MINAPFFTSLALELGPLTYHTNTKWSVIYRELNNSWVWAWVSRKTNGLLAGEIRHSHQACGEYLSKSRGTIAVYPFGDDGTKRELILIINLVLKINPLDMSRTLMDIKQNNPEAVAVTNIFWRCIPRSLIKILSSLFPSGASLKSRNYESRKLRDG